MDAADGGTGGLRPGGHCDHSRGDGNEGRQTGCSMERFACDRKYLDTLRRGTGVAGGLLSLGREVRQGVDRGQRGLLVVGLERWGGGARRQQSWLPQSGSRASALEKREGAAALLECESLLSLCGGGKLASRGGEFGVDRG